MSLVLVAVIAMPALAGIAVLLPGGRRAVRMGPVAASLSLALAALLTVEVASGGPVSALIKGPGGRPIAGLYADRLGVVLLLLVCAVSATVQAFARRYLAGDARDLRFFGAAGLLTAATAATVSAATLVGLALAWSLSGASLCLLLGYVPRAPGGGRRRQADRSRVSLSEMRCYGWRWDWPLRRGARSTCARSAHARRDWTATPWCSPWSRACWCWRRSRAPRSFPSTAGSPRPSRPPHRSRRCSTPASSTPEASCWCDSARFSVPRARRATSPSSPAPRRSCTGRS